MSKHDEMITALKHTRHDWLNVIQLIKGNLDLGHYKRIEEIIQTITQKSIEESKLYHLCTPELALFLIGYNWTSQRMTLSYQIEGKECSLAPWDQPLLTILSFITEKLEQSSSYMVENSLMISFLFSDQECTLLCDYAGKTTLTSSDWEDVIHQASLIGLKMNVALTTEYECIVSTQIKIP